MREMWKKKMVHRAKRKMYRLCRRAKRKPFKKWQDKQEGLSFALMGVGILIMAGCEESVRMDIFNLRQGFYFLVLGFAVAYIGAKLLEGVSE